MDGLSAFLGAAALLIGLLFCLLCYAGGRSGIAEDCGKRGIFISQEKVFTCQERKP